MEMDSEDESEKTYTTLENVNTEQMTNYQLQFEQFVVAERSDEESDDEEVQDEPNQEVTQENDEDIENPNVEILLDNLYSSATTQECTLKSDEVMVINSCYHKELKDLLLMNRSKNFMLMQIYKKIKDLLIQCRNGIENLTELTAKFDTQDKQGMFITHLAAPYFKTKKEMFSSKPNSDTLTRRKNGELSIYQNIMTPKWSKNECDNLVNAVSLTYNHNKQKAILKKITPLRFKIEKAAESSEETMSICDEISRLEEELMYLKEIEKEDVPPLGKDEFIDWDRIASEYLFDKHSALECRSFWHIYLHPDINKSNWATEENEKIKELAREYKYQDWDEIALKLGTKRSGFSVCLHYVSTLSDQFCKMRFTKEEDDMILEHVERMRIGSFIPWNAIEAFFPYRSRYQLVHRYKYFLNIGDHKSGAFTDAEDILILILVQRLGRNYSKFTNYIPNRTYMQIKARYDSCLRTAPSKRSFSIEEDRILMNHMLNGTDKTIGSLCLLLGRTKTQLRQRYRKLKLFFEKCPNAKVEHAPRKPCSNKDAYRKYEFVKCIAEQYKDHVDIPTVEDIEEKIGVKSCKIDKRSQKNKDNYNVDSLLINFFSNSYKLKQKPFETTTKKIEQATDTIFEILTKWKVNLSIPEELKKNSNLDIIDLEILGALRDKHKYQINIDTSTAVDDLIPPNINSLICLRGLLLKNNLYKNLKNKTKITLKDDLPLIRNRSDNKLASDLIEMRKNMSSGTIDQIENERCLFLERFISLFMWPALLSIEFPAEVLLDSELGIQSESQKNSMIIEEKINDNSTINTNTKRTIKVSDADKTDNPITKKVKLTLENNSGGKDIPVKSKGQTATRSLLPTRCSTRLKNSAIDRAENQNIAAEIKEVQNNVRQSNIIKIVQKKIKGQKSTDRNTETNAATKRILKIVKVENKKSETDKQNQNSNKEELPLNLKKVDKSEFEKMLNGEKPVQIYKLQKITMNDGSVRTIRKPILPIQNVKSSQSNGCQSKNCKMSNAIKSIITNNSVDNINILDMVSIAESVKHASDSRFQVKEEHRQSENKDLIDLQKLKTILHNNIRQSSIGNSSKTPMNNFSCLTRKSQIEPNLNKTNSGNSSFMKDKEDLTKLDDFLKNLQYEEDDDIIDLVEDEEVNTDVNLLNKIIKTERTN